MPRSLRPDPPGGWHHVMNRGIRRFDVFAHDGDRQLFLEHLRRSTDRVGTRTVAHCLMGNHYHLVLFCPDGGLSETMRGLASSYTRAFNREHSIDGALFRSRFVSNQIQSDEQLLQTVRYLDRNPLELGFRIGDYPWSSHRSFVASESTPWAGPELVLPILGSASAYASFVQRPQPSDRFELGDGAISFPPRRKPGPNLQSLIDLVDQKSCGRWTAADRRDVLLLVTRSRRVGSSQELARALGLPSASAVRSARARASSRVKRSPALAAALAEISSMIDTRAA